MISFFEKKIIQNEAKVDDENNEIPCDLCELVKTEKGYKICKSLV